MWSFGEVPPGTGHEVYVGFGSLDSPGVVPVTFTPGFDASRSADKTEFSAPGIQILTITVTPREATEQFGILIFADENDLVNPVITSPTSGDGIELRQEGHQLVISPAGLALNTTWTITVTIQVTPKVPEVEYLPFVGIGWREPVASGTASGNSFSLPVADMGTWTVNAEGDYVWNWSASLDLGGSVNLMASRGHTPPTLTSAGVFPPSDPPKTDFTFEATYTRDYHPSYVRVYIDGSAQDMGYVSGNYPDGALFSYTTTLSAGPHTYYFEASDISGLTARFPETGSTVVLHAGALACQCQEGATAQRAGCYSGHK